MLALIQRLRRKPRGGEHLSFAAIVIAIHIAKEQLPNAICPAADTDSSQSVTIEEIVQGRNALLSGCE